jgi:hypothetical protein
MKSVLVEDLSRSDDLDREEMLAVRGGILIMERPPEQGSQPPGFCGTGSPIVPGWPNMPSWPTEPGWPGGWPQNGSGPSGPCGPAIDPRLQ